jgi:hypothetical protein
LGASFPRRRFTVPLLLVLLARGEALFFRVAMGG